MRVHGAGYWAMGAPETGLRIFWDALRAMCLRLSFRACSGLRSKNNYGLLRALRRLHYALSRLPMPSMRHYLDNDSTVRRKLHVEVDRNLMDQAIGRMHRNLYLRLLSASTRRLLHLRDGADELQRSGIVQQHDHDDNYHRRADDNRSAYDDNLRADFG